MLNLHTMDTKTILALYDEEQRINVTFPGVRKEFHPHVIRYISEAGDLHFILYSQLEGANVDAVIAEEQAYFGPLGEVEWKVYAHDRPADLRGRLGTHGFAIGEPEAIMVLDLKEAPPWDPPHLGTDATVRQLESASQLADVQRIEEAVWEEDFSWMAETLAADFAVPDYLSVYVAYVDGQPACAGWIVFHPNSQFASLWGGSTVLEHRGKGLYTALLATRVQEAAARGYRFLTIDASPMSQPIAARRGFRLLTTTWACTWSE